MKSTKDIRQAPTCQRKKIRSRRVYEWRNIRCIFTSTMCTRASCTTCACLPFLLIGFRESTATAGGTLSTTRYLYKRASPSLRPHSISPHLYRLYRASQGRALIYLKDEVDVGASPPARLAARFSDASRFSFRYIQFHSTNSSFLRILYRLTCANFFIHF